MKSLYESILDDEDDLLDDQTLVIRSWCDNHIEPYHSGEKINIDVIGGKINIEGRPVLLKIDNGMIPDFIKWGDVSNTSFVCNYTNIKSFKNFPTKANSLELRDCTGPSNFLTMGKIDVDLLYVELKNTKSLKGLSGNIHSLSIQIDDLNEFDAEPNLIVDTLKIGITGNAKIKNIKKLPKIRENIIFDYNLTNYYHIPDPAYNMAKSLIMNNDYLKKIFKGHLSKALWKRNGFIEAKI